MINLKDTYEVNGVSVVEMDFKGNFAACYFLAEGVEGIVLNYALPKTAKPKLIDLLIKKSRTGVLESIESLNSEEVPNVKGLIYGYETLN